MLVLKENEIRHGQHRACIFLVDLRPFEGDCQQIFVDFTHMHPRYPRPRISPIHTQKTHPYPYNNMTFV